MKNLIFGLFFILYTSSIIAQTPIPKGTYTIGGNINYQNYSEDGSSNSTNILFFNPNIGYFFVDNFYTGLNLNYLYQSQGDYSSSQYGFGPTIRYYFGVEKIKPFLGVSYNYSLWSSDQLNQDDTQTSLTISGGINYFVTDYFALEGSINYSFMNQSHDNGSYTTDSDSKLLNIGIGVNYFIH